MENVLGAVWDANSAINAEQEIALNHKTVNHIMLNCIKEDRLPTESEKATLQVIAQGCPIVGGDAIYEARAILGLTYREFDDEARCANLVANPARNLVQVGEPFTILNQLGGVVRSGTIQAQGVSVAGLPSGLYLFVCGGDTHPVQSTKLVIITD
jgi:hypothetical protein